MTDDTARDAVIALFQNMSNEMRVRVIDALAELYCLECGSDHGCICDFGSSHYDE